ncbi:MAG: hypothetical protein Q4B70_10430 [Lachnospiraceae bacterium]|nr:hypothetical protein [Lachnospiraceae bacterium]
MSQRKVEEYKKYKANRKQILAREKRMRKIRKFIGIIVGIAVIGGFGYWGYYSYQVAHRPEVTFTNLITQDSYGFIIPTIADAE